ncbi:MAG: metal-dependent hydrolase, partial [Pseudomonadota bacterium]
MPSRDQLQLDLFAPDFSPPADIKSSDTLVSPSPFIRTPVLPKKPSVPIPALPPSPPSSPPAHPQRHVQLGPHALTYGLRRSKRRSIGFMIDDDGLRVTAPKWLGIGEIENAIREKQGWILSKLHERRERSVRRLEPKMRW